MTQFDLAIAWNWEFDKDYIHGLESECTRRGLSVYEVRPDNLHEILEQLQTGRIGFKIFYDRASDADEAFFPLLKLLASPAMRVINPHHLVAHAVDKATMHLEFITSGLFVPTTIILSPYHQKHDIAITQTDLQQLGMPFVIKPANTTGGGTGVVLDARSIDEVSSERMVHPDDKYLLQAFIKPKVLDGKRAWFRVYSVFHEIILCWWDDITHEYTELTSEEEKAYALGGLREAIQKIRQICELDFFSSEVALANDGKFVVVDYVNEICDMRLKSKYPNGAPDNVVHAIQRLVADAVLSKVNHQGEVTS